MSVSDPITKRIIERLVTRHQEGMKEYGTTMADNPAGTLFWIDNAIEEALDLAQYLERLKSDIQKYVEPELPL